MTPIDGTSRNVTLAGNVAYSNGSAAQLINGANVEVEATTSTAAATDLVAYSVSFQGASAPAGGGAPTLETNGLAYDVNLAATPPTFAVTGSARIAVIEIGAWWPKIGGCMAAWCRLFMPTRRP